MKHKLLNKLHALVPCLFAILPVQGQVTLRSVDDAWKYADVHNINISNAAFDAERERVAVSQSYMAFLPSASLQGTFTENTSIQTTLIPAVIFGGPDGTYRAVQFGQKYIYSGALTASLDLVNLQTWYNASIAKSTLELNKVALASTRRNVYQQIAQQYYNYLLMQEAARLAAESRNIADSVYQSVKHKFEEGTVGKGQVDLAELNRERADKDLSNAGFQLQTSKNALKNLLNLSLNDALEINASLTEQVSTTPVTGFADDPALQQATYQQKIGTLQYNAAKAAFLPTLSLQYSNSKQQNDNQYRPFQGGAPWYPASFYTVKASWTILGSGSRWLQLQRGRIAVKQAEQQLAAIVKQTAINDENTRINYNRAVIAEQKARHIMELSLDNYRHATNKFEAGIISLDERLNAFSDYINYQNQYLNSLSDLLVQLYNVKIRQQQF